MKYSRLLGVALLLVWFISAEAQSLPITTVIVEDEIFVEQPKHLGVNLGTHDQFGASQLLKNVITNPGFEAGEFASFVFVAEEPETGMFQQDNWETRWNSRNVGQPEGFWDGAEYEVLFGKATGTRGTVDSFVYQGGRNTFLLDRTPELNHEDVVMLRQEVDGYLGNESAVEVGETRPNSAGRQSLRLEPNGFRPAFAYYMDSLWRDGDPTAGKLMIVEGNWHFEVWAKGSRNGDVMEVTWQRQGEAVFLSETFPLTTEWRKISRDFYVQPGLDGRDMSVDRDVNGVLEFTIRLPNGSPPVWIDDIELSRRDYTNPTVFTDKVVHALNELQPGILRDWGGQLGSTFENQIAPPFARKTTGHSPRAGQPLNYTYSLHEFLELADHIDAEPWYVIPPTWTDAEVRALVAYLAAPAGDSQWSNRRADLGQHEPWTEVFSEIHLEFGNELWGGNAGDDPFIGATLRGGERVGTLANARFAIMRDSQWFAADKFDLIIGGQFGYPERQAQIEFASEWHDSVALSPYFGYIDVATNNEDLFYPLFARVQQDMQFGALAITGDVIRSEQSATDLAIYEINFHTTTGDIPLPIRNDFVTGMSGGIALPLYMLNYQKWLNVRNQAAFVLSQYSYQLENGEYARIWGLLRDLEATGRKRPTWLGLELANLAIRGDLLLTRHGGDNPTYIAPTINEIEFPVNVPFVQSFAYRDGDSYAVALFNLSLDQDQRVILRTPNTPDPQALLHWLDGDDIRANNETSNRITRKSRQLNDFSQSYELVLPPHSMQVVEWSDAGNAVVYVEPVVTNTPAPLPTATPDPDFVIVQPALEQAEVIQPTGTVAAATAIPTATMTRVITPDVLPTSILTQTAMVFAPTETPVPALIGEGGRFIDTQPFVQDFENVRLVAQNYPLLAGVLGIVAGVMIISFGTGVFLYFRKK